MALPCNSIDSIQQVSSGDLSRSGTPSANPSGPLKAGSGRDGIMLISPPLAERTEAGAYRWAWPHLANP